MRVERMETRTRTPFGTSATFDADDEGRRGVGRDDEEDVPVGTEAARARGGEATDDEGTTTEDGGGRGASTSTSVMSMSTSSVAVSYTHLTLPTILRV